ncbi:hypothetical protein GCM10009779_44420 [Polymorphospora rubra]|uniref:Uncharacterized protein n=1 Tax=Polymorphospora rubra TaxID=338584 RepID=A0A810N6E4_9ACTN|nr:hypothetical protein Prubr_55710 [Polymorphospora rubra]
MTSAEGEPCPECGYAPQHHPGPDDRDLSNWSLYAVLGELQYLLRPGSDSASLPSTRPNLTKHYWVPPG